MNRTRMLVLLPLFVGLTHSFSWDIVVGQQKRLKFYNNGTLTVTEVIPAAYDITSVTYDPVHNRVLFADYSNSTMSISSFDLSTKKLQRLVTKKIRCNVKSLAYDPVKQLLLWKEGYHSIFSLSLKPASCNKAVEGNLVATVKNDCKDIAVDSCGGFIYWITEYEIERAAFDGTEREVLIDSKVYARRSLAIDQETQRMYWIEETTYDNYFIKSADLNGKNRRTFHFIGTEFGASALAISKDFIYWRSDDQTAILQLPKNERFGVGPTIYTVSSTHFWSYRLTAANYTIKEQNWTMRSCEGLNSLLLDVEERYGSICQNYCFQGEYGVSAEGQPQCSCNRGYFGERCELNACYKHCLNDGVCFLDEADEPVCQCTAGYQGERCEVPICKDYCMQGNCSVSTEGQPTCRCNTGYSGERCEVNVCFEHCLNNGECFLNEEDEPVCQCTADYEGERCDVATRHTGVHDDNKMQQILQDLRSEVKQVIREELQCTLQVYSDKLDENKAKIQMCEESIKDDQ